MEAAGGYTASDLPVAPQRSCCWFPCEEFLFLPFWSSKFTVEMFMIPVVLCARQSLQATLLLYVGYTDDTY